MRLCTDANLQLHPSRTVTTAAIYTTYSAKPTAKDASGRTRRLIRLHGSLLTLPAVAKLLTLSRPFGVTTAPTLPMVSAALTAVSVAGPGTLLT